MPLGDELSNVIEQEVIGPKTDAKERSKILCEDFKWDKGDCAKIWCFGPNANGPNMLVDVSKGVQYLNEIKDSMEASFQWATQTGVIAEESMRGIKFNVHDANIHSDPAHRGGGQIMPCARRVFFASQLTAKPALQEPLYLVDIQTPDDCVGQIYQVLSQRRGVVTGEEPVPGTPLVQMKAYLPVGESFGFTQALRAATSGRAFPQMIFDHWDQLTGDPLEEGSKANAIV